MATTNVGAVVIGLGAALLAMSCSVPAGMNNDCQWPAELPVLLDLSDSAHVSHLRADVKVAEELGVRYDDTRLAQGPALDGQPKTRDECDAKLFPEIAALHSVDERAVLRVRASLDSQRPEAVVYLPLVLLYVGIAYVAAGHFSGRFEWSDEKLPFLGVGSLISVFIGASLVVSGHLWGGVVEMVRMGNAHMTYRAHRLGWKEFGPLVFVLGAAIFWALVFVRYRTSRSSTVGGHGVGLRTG